MSPLIGVADLVGFTVYGNHVAIDPTIRLGLPRNYNKAYSLFAALINALILYGALYFLPSYFEAVKG